MNLFAAAGRRARGIVTRMGRDATAARWRSHKARCAEASGYGVTRPGYSETGCVLRYGDGCGRALQLAKR
ncbi:MAG: hypothetical protein CTY31_10630 [Hyphomicrobium sp.]|nr:MAG: hypothetical protein CTY31_10630 [Hyphomicrobium sp.]